jgi:putative DNA primase/helicase
MAVLEMEAVQDSEDSKGTGGTQGTALNGAAFHGSPELPPEGTREPPAGDDGAAEMEGATVNPLNDPAGTRGKAFPPVSERPCYRVYDDFTGPEGKHPAGVWYHGMKAGKGKDAKTEPFDLWLCSPLHVEAVTCGESGRNFGRLLRFRDTFGRWRPWAMPMALLRGSCEELRGELLDAGVHIDHRERARLADYLQARIPKRRVLAALRTGWTADGQAFVLPAGAIGSEDVIFQAETIGPEGAASTGGKFDAWQSEIAARCVGNPVLALSVCAALAGPILAKIHQDSGGLHWVGDSSTGKSTALFVGASVWGGPEFRRTWRATSNGLEGAAAALNDTCLILDEIGEADPREIGAIVYSLGNGTGKSRANRMGGARSVPRWRLTLLSSGERTLGAHMAEGGKQPKAGHLMRLLNVPATRKFGAFDCVHGFPEGRALADHLKTAAGRHYGHAGPAFVKALLNDGRDFGAELATIQGLTEFQAADSQEGRAASRFALYGMIGELAAEWGVLPWPEGEALKYAAEGYRAWREARGNGITENRQILQAVADFIAKHGDGRFSEKSNSEAIVQNRAGWWIDAAGGRVHLFTSAGLRDATAGQDFPRVLAALDSAGWLAERGGEPGKRSKRTDVGGRKLSLYWIRPGELDE